MASPARPEAGHNRAATGPNAITLQSGREYQLAWPERVAQQTNRYPPYDQPRCYFVSDVGDLRAPSLGLAEARSMT
jgi:hypothetical protein